MPRNPLVKTWWEDTDERIAIEGVPPSQGQPSVIISAQGTDGPVKMLSNDQWQAQLQARQNANAKATPPPSEQPMPAADTTVAAALAAVVDPDAIAIARVAGDGSQTADQKMRAIYAIDNRAVGWNSSKWAEVLSVTAAAVRQTDWWREDRPRLTG